MDFECGVVFFLPKADLELSRRFPELCSHASHGSERDERGSIGDWLPERKRAEGTEKQYSTTIVQQRWTLRLALGCVNPASWLPLAAGHEFTQPRDHLIAKHSAMHDAVFELTMRGSKNLIQRMHYRYIF